MKGRAEASSVLLSSAFLLGFIVSERVTDHLADPICLFFLFAGGGGSRGRVFLLKNLQRARHCSANGNLGTRNIRTTCDGVIEQAGRKKARGEAKTIVKGGEI